MCIIGCSNDGREKLYWREIVKERLANYDLMRILMSFYVVCIHVTQPQVLVGNILLNNMFRTFVLQCDIVFFMLSGKFNLNKKFQEKKDYIDFYVSRFINILLPYVVITSLMTIENLVTNHNCYNIKVWAYSSIKAMVDTNADTHMWFMCALIGLIIGAPFLSKMLHSMKDFEVKILFVVCIVWSVVSIYIFKNNGFAFRINTFFMGGWMFSFVLGGCLHRIVNEKNKKKFYVAGVLGFIITVLGMTYLETFKNENDLSACFVLFGIASFLFMEKFFCINNNKINKFISWVAQYSFYAYMIHIFIYVEYVGDLFVEEKGFGQYIMTVIITFVSSYIVGFLLVTILIKPLQKLARVLLKRVYIT